MKTIYLAGPLFSEAERAWMGGLKQMILDLAEAIGASIEVKWPWEFVDQHELLKMDDKAGHEIFRRCVSHLESADMLIALLDGCQVDDGTSWEIGYFYRHRWGKTRPIIGIRTDFRNAGDCKNSIANAMIEHSCDHIFRATDQMLDYLERSIFPL